VCTEPVGDAFTRTGRPDPVREVIRVEAPRVEDGPTRRAKVAKVARRVLLWLTGKAVWHLIRHHFEDVL
jgi:hypothetical protein